MALEVDKDLEEALGIADIQWPVPIFELMTTEGDIKIYANGVLEGCPNLVGIMNMIPLIAKPGTTHYFSKRVQPSNVKSPT